MIEVLAWLLISVTDGSGHQPKGGVTVVERFRTSEECQRVSELIPIQSYMKNRCIQAHILVPK